MNPLRAVWRRYQARTTPPRGVLILLYHRVATLKRDPWSLAVTPRQFASHLSIIHRSFEPVPLNDLDAALGSSSEKPRVVITFDDGYGDNFLAAEPLLRQFDIPATVFLVSGAVGSTGEFWWDELERVLLESVFKRDSLEITIRGRGYKWTISAPAGSAGDSNWKAWNDSAPSDAHRLYRELYDLLFPLEPAERESVMTSLRDWSGLTAVGRETHRALSCQQTVALARSPGMQIGVHTANHPCLSSLPLEAQQNEILSAKSAIDELTGQNSAVFSYPFGKREHFSGDTVNLVRTAGFRYACTNIPGLVQTKTDPLQLPRVVVPSLDGEAFAGWLSHCFRTMN
jgi:peptidoglycan/xylan/chitin deacetylase (PgdA/CDA1 family)